MASNTCICQFPVYIPKHLTLCSRNVISLNVSPRGMLKTS